MSYSARRSLPPGPYGSRPVAPRPYYGARPPPLGGATSAGLGASALGGALGALGGTLGCLLCLAAIGALGLFSCVVAITAYTQQFLTKFKQANQISGAEQTQVALMVLFVSLFYVLICRINRN